MTEPGISFVLAGSCHSIGAAQCATPVWGVEAWRDGHAFFSANKATLSSQEDENSSCLFNYQRIRILLQREGEKLHCTVHNVPCFSINVKLPNCLQSIQSI